ncbi:MFS transporter, partial [Staphylococcus epidermidis]
VAKQYTASHSTMSKMKLTQEATVHGIDVAFIFTTVLIIIGFILALFIKEEKNH